MLKNLFSLLVVPIFLCLFLSACVTGQKQYDIGMQLSEAGKDKEAIAYLEQAIKSEPYNKKYKKALAEIKGRLVNQYVNEGNQILGSSDQMSIDTLNQAKMKLASAREIGAHYGAVKTFTTKVDTYEKELVSKTKTLYSDAKQFRDSEQWVKAYFNLQQIQSMIPNYEDSIQLMNLVSENGCQVYYDKAKAKYDEDDFKEATDHLRKALALKEDHQPARELLNTIREQDNKGYFENKAKGALKKKNYDAAITAYTRALTYDPSDKKISKAIGDRKQQWISSPFV